MGGGGGGRVLSVYTIIRRVGDSDGLLQRCCLPAKEPEIYVSKDRTIIIIHCSHNKSYPNTLSRRAHVMFSIPTKATTTGENITRVLIKSHENSVVVITSPHHVSVVKMYKIMQ